MNTIYHKTAKAERDAARLSGELRRALNLVDGRSGVDVLAARAAPSLRMEWSKLFSELVKGGYIVPGPGAGNVPTPTALAKDQLPAAKRVIAVVEKAAAEIRKPDRDAVRTHAELQAATKVKLGIEAKTNAAAEHARGYAALEKAINDAKTRSGIAERSRAGPESKIGMPEPETETNANRLHALEIENEALKKLLVEAYVKILALKARLGIKP